MADRPDDIPEDIWAAARQLDTDGEIPWSDDRYDHEECVKAMSRAILAERERCAKVADDHAAAWGLAMGSGAKEIAAAIRAPGIPS